MNVFKQFQNENNLDSTQLDDVINQAFNELVRIYNERYELSYDEDGVRILNLYDPEEEENLTRILLKMAQNLICTKN